MGASADQSVVPAQTLAERITAGPLGVEQALQIAAQIAEALEAAHEKRAIHQDLKPANVKVTPSRTEDGERSVEQARRYLSKRSMATSRYLPTKAAEPGASSGVRVCRPRQVEKPSLTRLEIVRRF
jgi:serine/threonine protein kinase